MKCANLDCPVRTEDCNRFSKKELDGAKSCSTRSTVENEKIFQILYGQISKTKSTEGT